MKATTTTTTTKKITWVRPVKGIGGYEARIGDDVVGGISFAQGRWHWSCIGNVDGGACEYMRNAKTWVEETVAEHVVDTTPRDTATSTTPVLRAGFNVRHDSAWRTAAEVRVGMYVQTEDGRRGVVVMKGDGLTWQIAMDGEGGYVRHAVAWERVYAIAQEGHERLIAKRFAMVRDRHTDASEALAHVFLPR